MISRKYASVAVAALTNWRLRARARARACASERASERAHGARLFFTPKAPRLFACGCRRCERRASGDNCDDSFYNLLLKNKQTKEKTQRKFAHKRRVYGGATRIEANDAAAILPRGHEQNSNCRPKRGRFDPNGCARKKRSNQIAMR